MNDIKLSIIVPVYNVEKYLERCINSLINQDLCRNEYEIIIVNDGSTDYSGDIAKAIQSKVENIHLYEQVNGGLSAARNTGLKYACGKYVIFVDSDDYLFPNTLGKVLECAGRNNLDMCAYHFKTMKADGSWYEDLVQPFKSDKIYTGKEALLNGVIIASVCANMYKRSFIDNNNLYFTVGMSHEDVDFNSRAYAFAQRIMFTKSVVYAYFWNDFSLNRSVEIAKIKKSIFDDLIVASNMRSLAAMLSDSELSNYYHRHANSIVTALLLSFISHKSSKTFFPEFIHKASELSLYPIKGKTKSLATTMIIPLLNNIYIYSLFNLTRC